MAARLFAFLCLLTALSARAQTEASRTATVIYLVRHAEPVPSAERTDPSDPSLSDAGLQRAGVLARMLGEAGITHVYSTDYRRTQETARPLAEHLGLTVTSYDPRDLEAFAHQLAGLRGRIVVAGHSNTTPALVTLLGGDPGSPIDDAAEFDRLYVVVLVPGAAPTSMLLRYGAPSTTR